MSQRLYRFSLPSFIPRFIYLIRFGIPRIEASLFPALHPRRVHRHASGAAQDGFGALPALNHISKLSAGRGDSYAILVGLRGHLPAINHISKLMAGTAIRTQSGYIRCASLAMPAIYQSGRGGGSVSLAVLYEVLPRTESGNVESAARLQD